MNLYDENGWINIPEIAAQGCWLNVIVGPRQVGKTYGVIKYLLDNDIYHMYMRRTVEELDTITDDPELNPYQDMENEGYHVDLQKQGKGWIIGDIDPDSEERTVINRRGIGMALSRIARIRGFSGQKYSDILLDEFIPEEIVVVRKAEGDAFKNALRTISGNRVLKGKPPLRVWMLANSNNLESPIMVAMNLIIPVEEMQRTGEEVRIQNGVCIALPNSRGVIEKQMSDPLNQYLNDGSAFAKMAYGNQFAYNATGLVRPKPVNGWKPFLRIDDWYIWNRGDEYYVTTAPHHKGKAFQDTREDRILCGMQYPEIGLLYRWGKITFYNALLLYKFKNYFGLKD